MPKDKDAAAPDYAAMFADESVPTVIVETEGGDVRMNAADFDAKKHKLSPNSHRVPDGYVPPTSGPAKKIKQPKANERYTIKDDATGKFFLANKDGVKLNEAPFDTAELAAAAEATIEV